MVKKIINSSLTFSLLFHPFFILAEYPNVPGNGSHPNPWPNTGRYLNPENDPKNKKAKEGFHLIPQSDPFPDDVTPEMIKCIFGEYKDIARKIKLIQDKEAHPEAKEANPKELWLVGKPGVGKTTIAAALALVLKRKAAFFKASSLAGNKMQNSGIEFIDDKLGVILKDMKACDDDYVVIIDELPCLTARFNDEHRKHDQASISHLWGTLDDLKRTGRVLLIATANEVDDIPEQMRSRSERNTFEIGSTSLDFRKKIIALLLKKSHQLSNKEIEQFAKKVEGRTNREIKGIILDAKEHAAERDAKKFNVTNDDILRAYKMFCDRQPGIVDHVKKFAKDNKKELIKGAFGIAGGCVVAVVGVYFNHLLNKSDEIERESSQY